MLKTIKAKLLALLSSAALLVGMFLLCGLVGLYFAVPPVHLVVILNSVLIGMLMSVAVAYSRLIWDALSGKGEWDRVRQMAIGIAILWMAYTLSTVNSVFVRAGLSYSMGDPSFITIASRYGAIVAAVLQITAPDLGNPLFYGRDRKLLWLSFSVGAVTALAVLLLQGPSLSGVIDIFVASG
jgi:hypothetical protein